MDSTIAMSPATLRAISAMTVKVVTALNLSATAGDDAPRAVIMRAFMANLRNAEIDWGMESHSYYESLHA